MEYDLSILIPSRNEMFISNTVADILENKRGRTEVIVGLDGQWAVPGIPDHPDVRIIYVSESLGQRGMTNTLARLSKAKYVAKCDAHVAFDEGFDVKLMDAIAEHDDWTIVPALKNLHAFDWKCNKCGSRWYQGPTPRHCMVHETPGKNGSRVVINPDCDNETDFTRKLVWKPNRQRPTSYSFRFDKTLHFQYFREFNKRPEAQGDLTETMSLQGSFFMMTRERYWSLNICDEAHGSWGQQGVEVACKTWLSGGQVMCLHTTWYAHMFRTQGEDFGFPYPNSGAAQEKAREYSRNLWFNNKWNKAIRPLDWLISKFSPVPDWHDGPTKGIIYYTDNQLPLKIAKAVQKQLKTTGLPVVSASLKPMEHMGTNIHIRAERGYLTMFKQILAALEASTTDIVFFCEHDVLYHQSHFDFVPPRKDVFYYNVNVWKVRIEDGHALWVNNCRQVSGICVYRETAIQHYKERIAIVERDGYSRNMGFEPGTRTIWRISDKAPAGRFPTRFKNEMYLAPFPNIDIRHEKNLTKNRWSPDQFRNQKNVEGWTETTIDKLPGWDNLGAIL